MIRFPTYESCTLCPRMCRIDRSRKTGYCGCTDQLKAARAALHKWEEPCLSGPEWARGGSGTVFFSGCTTGRNHVSAEPMAAAPYSLQAALSAAASARIIPSAANNSERS